MVRYAWLRRVNSKAQVEEVATVRFSGATEPDIMLDPEGIRGLQSKVE